MRASPIVPGHGPMTSRLLARSPRTSSTAHASPTAVAIGTRSVVTSAATTAAAVAVAATAAAAAAAAEAAATAAAARLSIFGDPDAQRASLQLLAIELRDRLLRGLGALHLDE